MLHSLDTGDMDWDKLTAAVELADVKSAANIAAIAEHLGEFGFLPDAKDESDIGHFLVDNVDEYGMNIEMEDYFDFSGFGEHFAEKHDGQFVNGGFVYFDSDRTLTDPTRESEPPKQTEPSKQAESAETPRSSDQSQPTESEKPVESQPEPAKPTEPPKETEQPKPIEPPAPTEPPVETQPKTAYDYEFDINAIRSDCIAIGQGMGYTLNTSLSPQNATWWNPITASESNQGSGLRSRLEQYIRFHTVENLSAYGLDEITEFNICCESIGGGSYVIYFVFA